ncbi:hypothetical protein ABPG75_007422 [Micractinium tetrahymenae]
MPVTACTGAGAAQARLQRQSSQRRGLRPFAAARGQLLKSWAGGQRAAPGLVSVGARCCRQRQAVVVLAAGSGPGQGPNNAWKDRQQRRIDQQLILGVGLGLTLVVLLALRLGGDAYQDASEGLQFGDGDYSFGLGDGVGALVWAVSLYFCSPLQLLLLFWGTFETSRPSDWVLRQLGQAAGLDVDAIDYQVPLALRAAAITLFGATGVAVAAAFQAFLGDATWSVSTGLGALMGAGMYEAGRPRRLNVEELQAKEALWQDFKRFADAGLQRRGRCHETDILRALGRAQPRYRADRQLDSMTLRSLVRNWHPEAERTTQGYYKGVSLLPAGDGSSGSSGSSAPAGPAAAPASSTDSFDTY